MMGLVERFNRTIKDMVAIDVSPTQNDWDEWLATLTYAYSTATHGTHGFPLMELMMGRVGKSVLDLQFPAAPIVESIPVWNRRFVAKLTRICAIAKSTLAPAQEETARHYNKGPRDRMKLRPGMWVWIARDWRDKGTSKLKHRFRGRWLRKLAGLKPGGEELDKTRNWTRSGAAQDNAQNTHEHDVSTWTASGSKLIEFADAAATAQCLIPRFTTFGCVDTWVPDDGSHFKNEVIEKVQKLVGAHHHITTANSPWANGTVEVVNRLVLRAVKALLSEMKLNADEWPHVLPLVKGALNHQPADRLGRLAPVTAFSGLPAKSRWQDLSTRRPRKLTSRTVLAPPALEEMHRKVAFRSHKLRQQAHGRRDRKSQVKFAGFSFGDFVLVGSVVYRPTKLALHWRGHYKVTTVITDHVMETQQLVLTYELTVHYACRLKISRLAMGRFHVERLHEARFVDGQPQVLVKWIGLYDEESSREPASNLVDDITVVFRKWAAANKEDAAVPPKYPLELDIFGGMDWPFSKKRLVYF
ncbi:hypothetical protein H257_03310 [Aphanomyces astaci]|uniref:Integrase catalytic domain-containing protein n=1 Tax=Aphanomyces astaci TaxID=112090 RepID=W4H304_APHAT|nr:hypothetical protein H257_03310 [Aphanomyces astaci]ETV85604.1 hypothetical protein H257_03310 [Aphanomyces astaci]|eukprot:XP_009825622.1 hypothetical protein H257_03310 [Aphanomyces astaci]